MTNEILDSDIELAQRLLDEGRLDAEIVKALGYRKIEAGDATKLIADLRGGRRIRPKMILLPRRGAARRAQK